MGAQISRNRRNDFARHFSIAAITAGMTAATGGFWYLVFKAVDAGPDFSDERFTIGVASLVVAVAFAVAGLFLIRTVKDGILSFLITLAAYGLFVESVIFLESPAENGLSASMILSALSVLAGSVLFISRGARSLRAEAAALMIGPLIFYSFADNFSRLISVGETGHVVFIATKGVFAAAALNALRRLRAHYAAAPLIGAGVLALAGIWFLPPTGAASIVILAAGFAANHRGLAAVGVLATTGFIGWYYYDLSATLLEKSAIMAAMGAATLAGALLARRISANNREARGAPSALDAPVRRPVLTAAAFGVLLALALANVNVSVWRLEADFRQARTIYLPLGPRDPRSLIQGDYMVLTFRQTIYPPAEEIEALPKSGQVFLRLNEEGVAAFSRIANLDDTRRRMKSGSITSRLQPAACGTAPRAFSFRKAKRPPTTPRSLQSFSLRRAAARGLRTLRIKGRRLSSRAPIRNRTKTRSRVNRDRGRRGSRCRTRARPRPCRCGARNAGAIRRCSRRRL